MTSPYRQMSSLGLDTDFAGMGRDDPMVRSPAVSLRDYDDATFEPFGDSMFPLFPDTQPNTQETEAMNFTQIAQAAPPRLGLDTTLMSMNQDIDVPFPAGAIGDRLYSSSMQQAPPHHRNDSVTSPAIMVGDQHLMSPVPPGQYGDRDFIYDTANGIYLKTDESDTSGQDIDLTVKVSEGYKVQRPPSLGPNMDGIAALHVGISSMCAGTGKIPPNTTTLLQFLHQQVSRNGDDMAPRVYEHGIDRPLHLDHLLMVVHRYGLLMNEHYNIGVIRPDSTNPPAFGSLATYTVSVEGPKTPGSKTIWLYEENGAWFPLARDNFKVATMSYADVLKAPVPTQRPVTPTSSFTAHLHPGLITPSTQNTPSEAGSDLTAASSFSCRTCGKRCESGPDLTHHSRNHRHRTLTCKTCGKTFLYSKDLKRHEPTHSGKESRMDYVCDVPACDKAYTRQDNLRRHQRQDHPAWVPPPRSVTSSRGQSRHG